MSLSEKNEGVMVLNDQGGGVMNVTYDVANTLRAQDHGHPPLILCRLEQNNKRDNANDGRGQEHGK